eukprot:932477-Pleurochrysis_carterae.AAC.1
MNQRLHEEDNTHRKTTVDEIIAFIGYIGALCLYPVEPLSRMWADKPMHGDILPHSRSALTACPRIASRCCALWRTSSSR